MNLWSIYKRAQKTTWNILVCIRNLKVAHFCKYGTRFIVLVSQGTAILIYNIGAS
jgi:hypothetical protein